MPRSGAPNPFANLRAFLEFWVDERGDHPCCAFATDEELESDVDQFDCQTCAVADALDALWPENRDAWTLSRQLATRWSVEYHLVPLLLDRATREIDADAFGELSARLALIYDYVYPPLTPAAEN